MNRVQASLIFDPDRRETQLDFVRERVGELIEYGDQVWVSITQDQAERFTVQGIHVQFHEQADLIILPAVVFDPAQAEPQPPTQLAAQEPSGEETAYYLVQFIAPPDPHWINFIEALGASYVEDVPNQTCVFRMTAEQTGQARETPFVKWVGLYHPAYAFSYQLAGSDEPFTADNLHELRVAEEQLTPTPITLISVIFFVDRTTAGMKSAAEAAGAIIVTDTGYSLIIQFAASNISSILRVPGVKAVGPYYPADLDNERAGRLLGANQVRHFGEVDFLVNLDGEGEIVGILDTGLDNGNLADIHPDLKGRVILLENINGSGATCADRAPHGTHVAGSIAGDGHEAILPDHTNRKRSVPRGIAPKCKIVFHSVNASVPPPTQPPFDSTIPCCRRPRIPKIAMSFDNFITAFQKAHDAGARVHNNSWGSTPGENMYTEDRSAIIDLFAFLHPDSLLIFSSGNDEGDAKFKFGKWESDGVLDQDHLNIMGLGKNVLMIGACENVTPWDGDVSNYRSMLEGCAGNKKFEVAAGGVGAAAATAEGPRPISDSADHMALFSSRGRVKGSRRVKPDLVAPGTNILSTRPQGFATFAPGSTAFDPLIRPRCTPPLTPASIPNPRLARTAPANMYYISSGTSMSAPLASGAAILVRQFYRDRFSQLRRPLLIEALATTTPPLDFVGLPSAAEHQSGCVLAWVRPTAAAGPNHAVAARFDRQLRMVGRVVQLQANIGDNPAIALARIGNYTLLAHRLNNNIFLSLYDNLLAPVKSFGTNGVVKVADNSVADDDRRLAICVHGNEAVVVWGQDASETLLFRRYDASNGAAIDAAAINVGDGTFTSAYPYLVHDGNRYSVVWVRFTGGNHELLMRFVDNTGSPQPAKPITLFSQAQSLRGANMVWDARQQVYMVVYAGEDAAGRHVFALQVRANGMVVGALEAVVTVRDPRVLRRPRVHLHPDSGYVVLWEDNTQGTHDLYMTFLNDAGRADGRITKNRLRISDTPEDIAGFSALVDSDGILPVWQSTDEINSDLRGVYALNVTKGGAFQSQADPNTPLLQNGHYVQHVLLEHDNPNLTEVAMAWGGGVYYHLRFAPSIGAVPDLLLVRTNADGKPDARFGNDGARRIHASLSCFSVALCWVDNHLIAAYADSIETRILLCDAEGKSITKFGSGGTLSLSGTPINTISVQVGRGAIGDKPLIIVAYGNQNGAGPHRIRYTVMDEKGETSGAGTVPPRDLVSQAAGTAKQGWFHLVSSDSPPRLIAAWHVAVGSNMEVRLDQFTLFGFPQGASGPIKLTALPGDSRNAVIAPRPIFFKAEFPVPDAIDKIRQREYGVAWQYRPAATKPWQIRFSRLDREGNVVAVDPDPGGSAAFPTADVAVFDEASYDATDPQLIWHTDGYGIAWLQKPVTGGNRQLFFTALDKNGRRPNLSPPVPALPLLVPDYPVSTGKADVRSFELVWNGRTFRITWTEVSGIKLRHMQSAMAVPRLQGETRFDEPLRQPSSALVRATLINGATNIRNTALPNFGDDPNDGYGWGRINLRQSLAPVPPVTFHVRDDSAVGSGRKASYEFYLPPNTRLLRITLAWTDPPGDFLVNKLNLHVASPISGSAPPRNYVGNHWQTGPLKPDSGPRASAPVPWPSDKQFQTIHNVEQIIIADPPAGTYLVEVISQKLSTNVYSPFLRQSFALVFVGSGPEIRNSLPSLETLDPLTRIY